MQKKSKIENLKKKSAYLRSNRFQNVFTEWGKIAVSPVNLQNIYNKQA